MPVITDKIAIKMTAPAAISLMNPILLSNSGCTISQIFSMAVLNISAAKTPKETIKIKTVSSLESFK